MKKRLSGGHSGVLRIWTHKQEMITAGEIKVQKIVYSNCENINSSSPWKKMQSENTLPMTGNSTGFRWLQVTLMDILRSVKKCRRAKYYYLCTEENCEQESSIDSVAQTEHAELSGSVVESPAAFYGEVRLSAGVPAWSHPSTTSM